MSTRKNREGNILDPLTFVTLRFPFGNQKIDNDGQPAARLEILMRFLLIEEVAYRIYRISIQLYIQQSYSASIPNQKLKLNVNWIK